MRPVLAIAAVVYLGLLWAPGIAGAAAITKEAAQPYIFTADLEAEVDPQGEEATCEVEFTTAVTFAESEWAGAESEPCAPGTLDAGDPAQRVSAELTGLDSDTEYHYRFVVTTTSGTADGSGGTFHTFGVEAFSIEPLNSLSEPDNLAGSHPYELVTRITLPHGEVKGAIGAAALAKDVLAELPPGLVGNPTAVEQCPVRFVEEGTCSGNSQVGVIRVKSAGPTEHGSNIYNVVPAKGSPARFAGEVNVSTNAYISASLRTGSDYGVNAGSFNLPTISNPYSFEIRLWGVPADPSHDAQRSCPGVEGPCSVTPGTPDIPFLRNPTSCTGPLEARVKIDSYDLPGTFFAKPFEMPEITGCDKLEFEPDLEVQPTSQVADSPTGLHVDLHIPQNEDPEGLATPDLRDAVVKLPAGLTLNPSSAAGLESCTPAQIALSAPEAATCPDAAKIGKVEVDTPLLDHSLTGGVYVATPYDNPFDSLLAIYIAVDDEASGVVIKLAGEVEVGAEGQLTTTFADNPQLPFEDFKLDFFGGERAALKTPATCGTYTTTSSLTPWSAPQSGPPATPSDSHGITSAPGGGSCATSPEQLPNSPGFEAGTEAPIAGAFSPFVLHLSRADGTQQFASLTVTPPPGLLGKLAGIPYCPDAALVAAAGKSGKEEQAAASCPSESEVGVVNVGAGAGTSPYYVQGRAYLAGPYKGAPLSLAIITPAVAGPYDLGTVVVRSALEVDPFSAQITVKSDLIPTELKSIPLDVRSIAVKMSRSKFTINPTSCEAMAVGGTLTTVLGQSATLSNRFQVGSCNKLGFKPSLKIALKGGTKRNRYPALKAVLTYPKKGAYANIARAQVGLPHSEFLEQGHIGTVCTRPQLAASQCPAASVYGRVKAWSPLLDKPLSGPVYLGTGFGHTLPDLVADLNGQIRVLVHARIDTTKQNGLRSTFELIPDAPVSRFVLEMKGGKKGLLVNSEDLCKIKSQRANARFVAHNGRQVTLRPVIGNSCGKKGKRSKR